MSSSAASSAISGATSCPGLYCGRHLLNSTHVGECGSCRRGFRIDESEDICRECDQPATSHDLLFLLFHLILVLVLHFDAIDAASRRRGLTRGTLGLHVCALLESLLASVTTVVVLEPVGQLSLVACKVGRLSDWYPYLHNPQPNYGPVMYCTHEVVYPLFTAIFVFHVLCALSMLLFRPVVGCSILRAKATAESVYSALYFLPLLSLVHALIGGVLYFSYPLVTVVGSLVTSAAHFAFKLGQSPKELCMSFVLNVRPMVILIEHWLLHAFGILTLLETYENVSLALKLTALTLVPMPAVYYILTAKFTAPSHFRFGRPDT